MFTLVCYYNHVRFTSVIKNADSSSLPGAILFVRTFMITPHDYLCQHIMLKEVIICMPAQWTAEIIGEMHLHSITALQLAAKIGWHPKYLSAIMNGRRQPERAEETCRAALAELIADQDASSVTD